MSNAKHYTRRSMELRVAEYYASIRKPESEWKTIEDMSPQLAEFEHRVCAEDYGGAGQILELADKDYLFRWGHYARLRDMRQQLLSQSTSLSLQTDNLGRLGLMYYHLGLIQPAIQFYVDALSKARELNDPEKEADYLSSLGRIYRSVGETEQALQLQKEALDIAQRSGNYLQEMMSLGYLGHVLLDLWEVKQAKENYERSLAIARRLGDRAEEGHWLSCLGSVHYRYGQFDKAAEYYKESLSIAHSIGDRRREGLSINRLGRVSYCYGQWDAAIRSYNKALMIFREIGSRGVEDLLLGHLGYTYFALGQIDQAIALYEQALRINRETGNRSGEAHHLVGIARAFLSSGRYVEGRQSCEAALCLDVSTINHRASTIRGIALLNQHNSMAQESFIDAAEGCQTVLAKTPDVYGPRYVMALALVGQAVCNSHWCDSMQRTGLLEPALIEYHLALHITSVAGVVYEALRDLELIRAAGIEGLEPVFALLEQALNANTPATEGGFDLSTV